MLHLISYDIADDDRRRRVFMALKDYGRRVQFSVFECDLDAHGLEELLERIDFFIDREEDSCRVYRICAGCAEAVRVIGLGDRYEKPDFLII